MRIGLGQDSHKIKTKNKKSASTQRGGQKVKISRLGALELKNWEIIANSDGDVILHALCNALSSAIGGDSLGTWADKMFFQKGITDSRQFLKVVLIKIKKKKFKVNNLAVCVEAKEPRLAKKEIQKIRTNLGGLLGIPENAVGLTFTSGEGITPFGRAKAIQAFVAVTLLENEN